MAAWWQIMKHTGLALDSRIKRVSQVPYTISYVIRQRALLDNLSELPKDKRPSDKLVFDGTREELEKWLEDVLSDKIQPTVTINLNEVE